MTMKCEIDFVDNPTKVISKNQDIFGIAKLILTKEVTIRGFHIKTFAHVKVRWTEGEGKEQKVYTETEDREIGHSTYYKDEITPVAPGTYLFYFLHYMKPEYPSSFESEFGSVEYKVHVAFELENEPDQTIESPFKVIKFSNLNTYASLRKPVVVEDSETFYRCTWLYCCASGPLKITASLPVGGYIPDQTIDLSITVSNKSNRAVTEFVVQLMNAITYQTNGEHKKIEEKVIGEKKTRGCEVEKDDVIAENIKVPTSVIPTDVVNKLIKIQYFCRVTAKISGWNQADTVLDLPLTIASNDGLPQEALPTATKVIARIIDGPRRN